MAGMSIYMSENEFRDFLRRFLEVRHEPQGVVIGFNVIEAERALRGRGIDNQRILNEAMEFVRQTAQKIVDEVKESLKTGEPFPYPVDDYR
jgi:hypothetical protein